MSSGRLQLRSGSKLFQQAEISRILVTAQLTAKKLTQKSKTCCCRFTCLVGFPDPMLGIRPSLNPVGVWATSPYPLGYFSQVLGQNAMQKQSTQSTQHTAPITRTATASVPGGHRGGICQNNLGSLPVWSQRHSLKADWIKLRASDLEPDRGSNSGAWTISGSKARSNRSGLTADSCNLANLKTSFG